MAVEIKCQRVKQKLDAGEEFVLLDCRERSEWDLVRLQGAILLPMSELNGRIGELDGHHETEIVVYCHHGVRSMSVAGWLRQQGFRSVFSMAGGIDTWSLEIDPQLPRY